MGAFFRRILAFVLGFVMSFATVIGVAAAASYWAYKNVKVGDVTSNDELPDTLADMTVEDFVADLRRYMEDPNSYSIGELEERYGVDLSDLLPGLDDDYKNINIFSLLTGDFDSLMRSVKLSVALGFLPEGTFSDNALEILGDHTLYDLVNGDQSLAQKLVGLFGKLKVGDILAFLFENRTGSGSSVPANGDFWLKDEYTDGGNNGALVSLGHLLGNLEIAALIRAFSPEYEEDILDEFMDGGLTDIADSRTIGQFLASLVPEDFPVDFEAMFGDKTIRDIITGKPYDYSINFGKLFGGITVADIFGAYTEDGVVYDRNGNPATGLLRDLADLNVGNILSALTGMITDGSKPSETLDAIVDYLLNYGVIDDLTVGSLFETLFGLTKDENGNWLDKNGNPLEGPLGALSGVFDLNIADLLDMIEEGDFSLDKLAELLDGMTLGDFLNPLLGFEKDESGNVVDHDGNAPSGLDALLAGVAGLSVPDILEAVDSLIKDGNIVPLLDALLGGQLGDVTVGDILGYTKGDDGVWRDADGNPVTGAVGKLLDFNLGDLYDTMTKEEDGEKVLAFDWAEMVDYMLSGVTLKDLIESLLPELYDQLAPELEARPSVEKLFDTPLGDILKSFLPDSITDVTDTLLDTNVADLLEVLGVVAEYFGAPADVIDTVVSEIKDIVGENSTFRNVFRNDITVGMIIGAIDAVLTAVAPSVAENNYYLGAIHPFELLSDTVVFTADPFAFTTDYLLNDLKKLLIADIANNLDETVTYFLGEGELTDKIGVVFDSIADLYEDADVEHFIDKTLDLNIHKIIDSVANITDAFVDLPEEMMTRVADILKRPFETWATLGNVDLNGRLTVTDATDTIEEALDVVEEYVDLSSVREYITNFLERVKAIRLLGSDTPFGDVMLKEVDPSVIMFIDTFEAIAGILTDFVPITKEYVDITTETVMTILDTETTTLTVYHLAEMVSVGNFISIFKEVFDLFLEEDNVIYDFLNPAKTVYGDVWVLKDAKFNENLLVDLIDATLAMNIHKFIDHVVDIVDKIATLPEGMAADIKEVVKSIFDPEATFGNVIFNGEITVGDITDDVRSIFDMLGSTAGLEMPEFVAYFLDHVDGIKLVSGEELRGIKIVEIDPSLIHLFDVIDVVAGTVKLAAPSVSDYIDVVVSLAEAIINRQQSTLTEIWLNDATTIHNIVEVVRDLLALFLEEDSVVYDILNPFDTVYGDIVIFSDTFVDDFVDATLGMNIHKFVDHVVAIADKMGILPEGVADRLASLLKRPFTSRATFGAVDIDGSLYVRDVTGMVDDLLFIITQFADFAPTSDYISQLLADVNNFGMVGGGVFGDVSITSVDPSVILFIDVVKAITRFTDSVAPAASDYTAFIVEAVETVLNTERTTLTRYFFKKATTVADLTAIVRKLLGFFLEEDSIVFGVLDITDDLFGSVHYLVPSEFTDAAMGIEIFPTVRDVLALFGEDALPAEFYTVLDALENLYDPDGVATTVGSFVDDTLGLLIYDIIDMVTGLVDEFVDLPEGIVSDIGEVIKSIFDPEATVGNVIFNEGITVGQITDDIRTVLATAEAAGAVLPEDVKAAFNTFLDMTDDMTLVDGTKFADQVIAEIDPANIYIYGVIDILSATAKHLAEDKYVDVLVESIEDVILPNSTFADLQIDGSKTVGDVIGYINRIVLVYTQRNLGGVVGNLLGFIDDKFGDVRLAYFADDAYEAAKKLEIPTTLKDFLDVFGVRSEFEFYELFEKEDGTYLTVGDFIDDTDNALNTLMGHIEGIDQINDYLADLYFDKDFAELTDGEKAAIYGTYAAVAVGAIVCYFVFNDQIYDYFVTNDTRISDYVAPDSISDDPDLVKLLTELFDLRIASIMAFVHGRDGMDAPTFFREALDNIRIGDVVAAFTAVTEAGPYWTDNGRRFNVAFEMLFDVYFADPDARADLYGLIEGSAEITDVYDYEALAVIDGVGIVADIFTIVEGEIGELPNELSSKIVSVTDAVVRLIFVPESQLINPEFNVVSVRDLLVLTDSILAIFDLDDNAVYLAIRHPIDTIIGDAELLAINPFAFTPETIVDEFMGTQIDLFISEMCDMFGNLGLGPVQLYDEIKLALQKIFDGTMGEPEYNEDYSVHDITSSLTSVFRVAEEQDLLGVLGGYINIIYTVLDEIDNLAMAGDLNTFGQVKLIEIDRAADIKVRGIFSAVGEIVKSIELPVENETIDSVVGIVSAIFDEEATVSDWKITELKVSFFTDEIESILSLVESLAEGFTTPEAVTVFLTEIDEIDLTDGGKFGDVIVTEFDPSVIPYYYLEGEGTGVIDVVVDTVVTAVPEAEDYLNLAADLFKAVFRETSTLTKYYIKGGLTVSDILAVVNDGLALFLEEGNVAFGIVDILDGIYGPIEILSGTVGQDFIDATMAIEIFPTVRDVLDLFEEGFLPESIYTVVDALEALYDPEGDTVTTVGTFVDDTLNLKIHAAIYSVTGLVDDLAELPEGLMTDIADVLKSIFDKEAQFNNVIFNEDMTVGEITDDIRSILDTAYVTANFETPEFVTALLDGIDNIKTRGEAGTLLKDVAISALDPSVIPYYYAYGADLGVLDVLADVVTTAAPEAEKYVNIVVDVFSIIFNDVTTLTYYEFNGDLTVSDILAVVDDGLALFLAEDNVAFDIVEIVDGIYGEIRVFSDTLGQDFLEATKAIEIFPTVRDVLALFNEGTIPEAVYTVVDALEALYDPEGDTVTTVGSFVDDTLNLRIHAAIDSVAGIIDDLAEIPEGLMADIADVIKSIFDEEAQFNNVLFNSDITVGELTDDIRSILDAAYVTANFETPEFVTALLDGVDNVKTRDDAGTLLKDVQVSKLDPSVIPYYHEGEDLGVLDVVADTIITAAPAAEKYVNLVTRLFELIFRDTTTLTKYYVKSDLTINDAVYFIHDAVETIAGKDFTDAIDNIIAVFAGDESGENGGIYGDIRIVNSNILSDLLKATLDIEIFPTFDAVIANIDVPEQVTDISAILGVGGLYGATKVRDFIEVSRNLTITNVVRAAARTANVLGLLENEKVHNVAAGIADRVDELYGSSTVVEFASATANIYIKAFVQATFDILSIDFREIMPLALAGEGVTILDREVAVAASELIGYLFADSARFNHVRLSATALVTETVKQTVTLIEKIIDKKLFGSDSIGQLVLDFIYDNFGEVRYSHIAADARDAAAALEVYEIIDFIGGIADRIPAVPEGITASSVKLLKDLLKDSVVTEIGINEEAIVGTLTDDVYGLVKAAASFENEKADGVVGSLSNLFANVRVLHFTEDFVNIEIADIGSAVNAIVEVFVTEGPVHRIITTLVDEFVLLVKEGATIGNFGFVDNITLGLINDALARVLFEKDMATLLAGEIQDKVKAYIIYYIDFNVGAILYMTARDLVTDILGDMTVNTEISIAGKTPEISYMIRDVKLNDILRATIDKFTGSVDRNGTMPFTQFLNTYFEGATVGDVIGVFLPEKIANKRGVQHVLDTLLLDVYRVIRHQIGKGEFLHIVLDGVVAGDFTNDKVLSFNGNQIGIFNYLNKIELNDLVAVTIPRIRPVSGYPLMSGTAFLKKYFTEEGGYITEFGLKDATVKDLIGPFVPAVISENVLASGNTVGEEVKGGLLNLSLYDIFLTVMGRMGKRALLYKALDGIRLGNVIGLTYTDGETTAYWAQSDGSPRIIYSPNEEELRYMDSVDYVLKALINDVLYTDLGKLVNPTPNLINQLKSGEASLGDVLDLEHEDGENGGRWYRPASAGNVYAIPLWNAVYNLKYTDLEGGVRKLILDRFGYLRVGEIFFDISFDETIGKWIYNPSDEVIFEDGKLISRIQKNLFKLRLEDITVDGQLSADRIMDHLFEDIYIGDAMGYHITSVRGLPQSADTATEITFAEVVAAYGAVSEVGEGFYKITDAATDLYYVEERNAAGETECYFLEFEDGRYVKKVMAVTDIRKIEYDELAPADYTVAMLGYVWTADGEPVDSVYSILANTRIDQVFGIGGDAGSIPLLDDIGWLAIADFDIDFGAESSILDKVADIPLCRIGDAMNDLYIGELIGYDMGEGITITEDAIGTEYTAVVTVTDDETGTEEIVVVSKEIDGSTVYYKKHGDLWYKAILTESARRKTTYVAAYQRRESTEEAYTLNHLADYDFDWKDGGETLNGLSALMAGLSIFTILNEDFNTHIEWMGIKDVFTNPDFDNNILSAISDYPLCDIDNAINSLSIADVMGYKYASEALTEKPDGAETVVSASGSLPEVIKVADKYYKYVVRYEDGAHVWYEVDSSIADAKNAAAAKDPDASGKTEYDVTAADYTFKYKDGEGATAKDVQVLNALIADLTVANIGSGLSGVIDRIQWLTLKNVLGEGNSLFKDNTLFDIIGDKPIRSIGTEIDNISIGQLMDYHREGGVEIAESDIATIALTYKQVADHNGAAIAGVVVDEATNTYYRLDESDGKYYPADSKIADRKRADNEGKETEDLTAITADDYTFKYTDSDVSAVNKVIGSFTIGSVTDGNMMDTLLWLSPAELLGESAVESNAVFKAVGEQPMCKIDQAINNVVVGDLMGYEYGTVNELGAFTALDKSDESGKWYEVVSEDDPAVGTYKEVKGISAVMAGLTIDGLGNGEFSKTVSTLGVADVIDFEPLPEGFNPDDPKTFEAAAGLSILSFVYAKNPDVQLEDLGTAIQQTVATLTLGEMELIGMLDFGLRSGDIRMADWVDEEHNFGRGLAKGAYLHYTESGTGYNDRKAYEFGGSGKDADHFVQTYWPTRYLKYGDKITLDSKSENRDGLQFPSDATLGFKLDMLVFAFRYTHSASYSLYGQYYYHVVRTDDSVVHSPETPCDDKSCLRCHPGNSIVIKDMRNYGEFDARKKAIYEQVGGTYRGETYTASLKNNESLYELYDWRDLYVSEFLGFFINDVFNSISTGWGNNYRWPTYGGIQEGNAINNGGTIEYSVQQPGVYADFFWNVGQEVKA